MSEDDIDELSGRQAGALTMARGFAYVRTAKKKQWVIDQMVRALTGKHYAEWVENYNASDPATPWQVGHPPQTPPAQPSPKTLALRAAHQRLLALLDNPRLPNEERHATAVVLDLVTRALEKA